ncbi:MAG: polymer-forming cytoskeletal protein [Rhodothermales bacterium]|nr:polymer-forming cytoskeletal protein [Rhodothermales bacterium]
MSKQPTPPSNPGQINMIGEGTVIEGTLRSESDVRVSGRIVGNLDVEGKVIVAKEGSINGELVASSADIAGDVQGQINIKELCVLKGAARVDADIKAARLVVEEGATFNGQCEMGQMTSVRTKDMKGKDSLKPSSPSGSSEPSELKASA